MCRSTAVDEEVGDTMPVAYELAAAPIRQADGIPIRLTMRERKMQRLARGVLLASSYTDRVDTDALSKNKSKRTMAIVKEVLTAIGGLLLSTNLGLAAKIIEEHKYEEHKEFTQNVIEVSRRYKVMNPDLLRTDYVKFLYLLQDAVHNEDCRESLGYNLVTPILTVGLQARHLNAGALLADARLPVCITPVPMMKDRAKLKQALRFKDLSVKKLCKEHAQKSGASVDDIELLVRSLNDANTYATDNVSSTEQMIELLLKNFSPETPKTADQSLRIKEGLAGSRLTHEHAMQYTFVLQSLTLWKNICRDIYRLWVIAERDLLNPDAPYELRNTGQGLQRVQPAPELYEAVSTVLADTKAELGQWVGSERIHLGDNQVPNAFSFIDKYAQISRIIIPVLRTVEVIMNGTKDMTEDSKRHVEEYVVDVFGSREQARTVILADFFRHAFDGSGGDNKDDAGSCIDGRLTSAWNWCNQVQAKPYYPLFLLAGFNTFDGDLTL
jgi:hypothetical protein